MEERIVMFVYIAVTAVLALVVSRRSKSSKEFFLGSSGLGVVFVVTMIFSENIGGTGTVGDAAEAFSSIGMGAVWSTWGLAVGCLLFAFVFGKFYRVLGAVHDVRSVPSAYEVIFGTRTKNVVLFIIGVVYMSLFALQPIAAAGILAPMFGLDRTATIIGLGVLFVVIACAGGLGALARMNKMHAFVMWFGLLVVAILAVRAVGGVEAVALAVPEGYLSPTFPGLDTIGIWLAGAVLSSMSSAILAAICLSADSIKSVRKGAVISFLFMIAFACFPAVIGICASVAMPDIDPQTALYVFSESLSPWVGGLASVAVIAAIFSTAPALLLIVGTMLSEDLYHGFINKQATDKQVVRAARIAMAVIGAAAIAISLQTSSIFSQLLSIFQMKAIVAVVLIVALVWPRVSERASFYSMLLGGSFAIVWHFLGSPLGIQPLIPALVVGLAVLVALTLASPEKVSPGYRVYQRAKRRYAEMTGEGGSDGPGGGAPACEHEGRGRSCVGGHSGGERPAPAPTAASSAAS